MSRPALAAALALAVIVDAGDVMGADAAEPARFGQRGRVVVALDHLTGFVRESLVQIAPSGETKDQTIGLDHYGVTNGYYAIGPISRLGVHYFATENVSVGMGAHYSDAPIAPTGGRSLTTLGISPRLGFVQALSPSLSLWLRVGVTYFHMDYGRHVAGHDLMIGGELQLVSRVVPHFSVLFGPTLEVGIAGGIVNDTGTLGSISNTSQTRRNLYGLTLGFAFDF